MSSYLDYAQIGDVLRKVADAGGCVPQQAFPENSPAMQVHDSYAVARKWRHDLSWGISWAYTAHHCFPDWTSDSRSRRRLERLVSVRNDVQRVISALMDEDLALAPYLTQRLPAEQSLAQIVVTLEQLAGAAKAEVEWLTDSGLDSSAPLSKAAGLAPFPTEGMGYISLMAKAYGRAFGTEATIQYDSAREPAGPFLAFVMAVQSAIEAAGIPAPITNTPAAIDQAFKRWRRSSDNQRE